MERGAIITDDAYQNLYLSFFKDALKRRISPPWGFIAIDIGIYLGECLIKRYPSKGISWGYVSKPKMLDNVNRPVLIGIKERMVDNFRIFIQTGYYCEITYDLMHLTNTEANEIASKSIRNEYGLLDRFRRMQTKIYQSNSPQNLLDLHNMNKADAIQYYNWFMHEMTTNIKNIGMCVITDFSMISLTRVWERFLDAVEKVHKEGNKRLLANERGKKSKKTLLKINIDGTEIYEGVFTSSLDISLYFAEVFRRHHERSGIKWGYLTDQRDLTYVNRPTLTGFGDPDNPVMDQIGIFSDLAVRVSKGERNKDALVELFKEWERRVGSKIP